jgi:ribonucleotide monophosphatase NagD (HAD superfamily)
MTEKVPMNTVLPPLTPKFSVIAPNYDVLMCDVWGVIHNGMTAFPPACDALMRVRARGGLVVLASA